MQSVWLHLLSLRLAKSLQLVTNTEPTHLLNGGLSSVALLLFCHR